MNDNFKDKTLFAFALYGAVGFQLAISVVAGLVLGNYLDGKLNSSPIFLIAGVVLGLAAGLWNLVRILKRKDQ